MYKRHKQYRLPGFSYAEEGSYFITIVTRNREPYFGYIKEDEMQYSLIGNFVKQNMEHLQRANSKIVIDAWTVMPNHIHLIISIHEPVTPHQLPKGLQPLIKDSISSFVNHFKGFVTKWFIKNGHAGFAWQARFHDRIIRNEKEYNRIKKYIDNNVLNWKKDNEL